MESHPFKHFNFKLIKTILDFDNPISQLFVTHLNLDEEQPIKKGWILPVAFPTGIGKTHNVLNVILEKMLYNIQQELTVSSEILPLPSRKDEFNHSSQIIFMTNSVDNVFEAYQELLSMIDRDSRFNEEQKFYLKNQVIYTPDVGKSLKEAITQGYIDDVLEIFGINDSQLVKEIREFRTQIDTINNEKNKSAQLFTLLSQTLDNLLVDTFTHIFGMIVAKQMSKERVQLSHYQIDVVAKLLPAIKMEYNQSSVIFLTTKKFLFGLHQTQGKHHLAEDMQHHILIIDEVDRQNDEILSFLVESSQLDILTYAKTLYAKLNVSDISHRHEYAGVSEKMSEFYTVLSEFVADYRLSKTFDIDKSLEQNQPKPLLFSDKLATNLTNINSTLFLTYDKNLNQNIIFDKDSLYFNQINSEHQVDQEKEYDSVRFAPVINQLDKLISKDFIYTVLAITQLYQRNTEKLSQEQIDSQSQGERNRAINTVLQQFNIRDMRLDILNKVTKMTAKSKTIKQHDGTYHTRGISLMEIQRPKDTDHSVIFFHQSFNDSPTGMLASWVEQGCQIIGISATATNQSVVHNFDVEYLRYRLSDKFVELTDTEKLQIEQYYHQQRNYGENEIALHFEKVTSNPELALSTYCQIYHPNVCDTINLDKSSVFDAVKQQFLDKFKLHESDNDFALNWVSKVLQVISNFCKNHQHHNRYLVFMLNRHLNNETAEFIEKFIQRLDDKNHATTKLIPRVDAKYLKSGGYDKEVKEYLSTTHNKVIVFTTYKTFSSGINPDYCFDDWEMSNLINVAHFDHQKRQTDIDCLYLEKPTNMISGDNDNPLSSRMTLLAQGMALQEANQLSNNQAFTWANQTIRLQPYEASLQLRKQFYHKTNSDYIAACCRDIEQAIGRTNRTGYKRPHIYFWYDDELIDILSQDKRQNIIFSHEYRQLLDKVQAYNLDNNTQANNVNLLLQNRAQKTNKRTLKRIDELLSGLNEPLDTTNKEGMSSRENFIFNWQQLRLIVGRTPNSIDEPAYPNARYYLEVPEPENSYFYLKQINGEHSDQDNNLSNYLFFEKAGKNTKAWKVSEQDCRLSIMMKNSTIKSYFETKNLATTWLPNAKFFMTPAMYNDIYKGMLGEEGGMAILESQGFSVSELPIAYFERFDNLIDYQGITTWIDFKHWSLISWKTKNDDLKIEVMEKISKKFKALQTAYQNTEQKLVDKLIVCNLMGDTQDSDLVAFYDSRFEPCDMQTASIMTIAGIIDEQTGETNLKAINALKNWLLA